MTENSQAGQLWCIHFLGPDDLVAAPSESDARAVEKNFNAFWEAKKEERGHDVRVVARAERWPYSAQSHTDSLAGFEEYRDLLEPWTVEVGAKQESVNG